MASVQEYTSKTGERTFKVRFRHADKRAGAVTFDDRAKADRFVAMLAADGVEGALQRIGRSERQRAAAGVTVADAVERYAALRPNPSTRDLYRRRARCGINPELGDIAITELTRERVQLWVNGAERSSETVRAWLALLSGSLNLAVERGELSANPATKVRIPRTRREKPSVFLTRDEFDRIAKCVPHRHQPLVHFLMATGCRIGEALALTPSDISLDKGTAHFRGSYSRREGRGYELGTTKTAESERIIRVPQRVLEMLDLSGEYVFTTRSGARVQTDSFRNVWALAVVKSGLPKHRWPRLHDIRHTHASQLITDGIPLPAVSKRLGHADVMITLRVYGHIASDAEDQILAALG